MESNWPKKVIERALKSIISSAEVWKYSLMLGCSCELETSCTRIACGETAQFRTLHTEAQVAEKAYESLAMHHIMIYASAPTADWRFPEYG